MLGAAIALRRACEHIAARLSGRSGVAGAHGASAEALALMIVALFLVVMIPPARQYVELQWRSSPRRRSGIPRDSWPGRGRHGRHGADAGADRARPPDRAREPCGRCAGAAAVITRGRPAPWLARPALASLGNLNLLIFFFVGMVAARRRGSACRSHSRSEFPRSRDSRAHHAGPADHHGEPHGRRHLVPDPPVGAAVRRPRAADRDGWARPCALVDFMAALIGHCARRPPPWLRCSAPCISSPAFRAPRRSAMAAAVAPALFPEMRGAAAIQASWSAHALRFWGRCPRPFR